MNSFFSWLIDFCINCLTMAYVNVKEWSVDQVIDWLKGLDSTVLPYKKNFLNNEMTGEKVLALTSNDLENLGVTIIGHQEILLEAVQHLRNFHYELDKENLQMFALRLSCAANSLYNELHLINTNMPISTEVMSGVHNVILKVKPIVSWLTRNPFNYNKEFASIQENLLSLCVEMAFSAHRDIFSENPIETIRDNCLKLTRLADNMIKNMTDPLILQPAALNLTTLRKKEQELGLFIFPNYHLVHQIAEFKHGSPAHLSRKLEIGDEIVQVNYQTVVSWQRQNVMLLLRDSPPEVFLTLKKLPQHTKVYGPIYMKPYRLPSKKRATPYSRWNENLPSPRLLSINDLPQIPTPKAAPIITELDNESSSDNDTDPPDSPLDGPKTLYPTKSTRPVLQRRNTISGATSRSTKAYPGIEQFLQMYKANMHSNSYHHIQANKFDESTLLRDKSASCSHGLELTLRPTTVIGLSPNRNKSKAGSLKNKKVAFEEIRNAAQKADRDAGSAAKSKSGEEKSVSVNSLNSLNGSNAHIDFIDEAEDLTDRSNMGVNEGDAGGGDADGNKIPAELRDVHVHSIIKKFDEKIILQESNPPVINNAVRAKIQNRFVSVNDKETVKEKEVEANEIKEKVWEYNSATVTNNPVHVTERADTIKYELGIPIVEAKNSYMTMSKDAEKIADDVPPKPPPRAFVPAYKPKYPADSPKPVIDLQIRKHSKENIAPAPPPRDDKPSRDEKLHRDEKLEERIAREEKLQEKSQKDEKLQEKPERTEKPAESRVRTETEEPAQATTETRRFEPKPATSTPLKMSKNETDGDVLRVTTTSAVVKSSSMSKVSPTNSIVRAMIGGKGKSMKKKNTLTARKRKVSVNDVSPGDMEGHLHQRFRPRDGQTAYWDKLWFVLIGNRLYGFTSREATKANVLIYLTGFTVSLASEVKSKTNAFKVYHTGTVFYFSAETRELMNSWIESISEAILRSDMAKPDESVLYSETDDSDTEKPKTPTEKTEGIKKFGSLKKFKKGNDSSHSLDRKWFFNKSTTSKNSVPVPTAQFRSYRKITSNAIESVSTGNFTSHVPNFAAGFVAQNVSVPNLSVEPPKFEYKTALSSSKAKTKNYSHASNPSLYNLNEFNPSFAKPTPRDNFAGCITLEELMRKQKEEQKLNPLHVNEAINLDLIKPDVVYGEVPIRPKDAKAQKKQARGSPSFSERRADSTTSSCFGRKARHDDDFNVSTYPKSKHHQDAKNNRSLPRTHKIHPTYDAYLVARRDDADFKDAKLKSVVQYTPMTVPLGDDKARVNPKLAFELNLDEKSHRTTGGVFKSLFHKESKKEKVASPKMGRLMLRRNVEDFQQVQMNQHNFQSSILEEQSYGQVGQSHIDYPDLEYPPVFQPETYSLADPQSLTLLRKQGKNN